MNKVTLMLIFTGLTIPFHSLWALDHNNNQSVYTLKPNDPQSVYFTRDFFKVASDGVGDDAPALQAAIDQVLKQSRNWIVFIPEGTYRLGKTVYLWSGIRFIGFGTKRPIFKLADKTPGKIYEISMEHHKDVEVIPDNVENWSFYALQLEEDRGSEKTLGIYMKDSGNILFANLISHRTTGVWEPYHTCIQIRNSHEISIRGNEMRVTLFPFDNELYDEITGSIVPQRIFTKLTAK
jgi:hypothetical protein